MRDAGRDYCGPAVKELIRVELTSRVPELLRRAFAVATSGRPGRYCSMYPRMSATASTTLPLRLRDRSDDAQRAGLAHPAGPRRHR